jgi:hypothetical protein
MSQNNNLQPMRFGAAPIASRTFRHPGVETTASLGPDSRADLTTSPA